MLDRITTLCYYTYMDNNNYFKLLDERDAVRKSIQHRANVIRYDLEKIAKRIDNGNYPKYYHSSNFEGLREVLEELKEAEEKVKLILKYHTEKP